MAHPSETKYLLLPNVVSSIATFGGLINSGVPTTSALYRKFFNPDGTLSPFVIGHGHSDVRAIHHQRRGAAMTLPKI